MGIKLMKLGVSAGVGGVDALAEYIDEKQAYTKPFQNLTDWGRALYVVGGYGANYMDFGDKEITETMVLSGIPLLEKSIIDVVKTYIVKPPVGRDGKMGLELKRRGNRQAGNIRWG